jgi:hypothetical protein
LAEELNLAGELNLAEDWRLGELNLDEEWKLVLNLLEAWRFVTWFCLGPHGLVAAVQDSGFKFCGPRVYGKEFTD